MDEKQRKSIFELYKRISKKKGRNSYLRKLISTDEFGDEIRYMVQVKSCDQIQKILICRKAFLSMHGITGYHLFNVINAERTPKKLDAAGFPDAIRKLIEYQLRMFKTRRSCYSFRSNPERKYLPETLSRNRMHSMFLNEFRINHFPCIESLLATVDAGGFRILSLVVKGRLSVRSQSSYSSFT